MDAVVVVVAPEASSDELEVVVAMVLFEIGLRACRQICGKAGERRRM